MQHGKNKGRTDYRKYLFMQAGTHTKKGRKVAEAKIEKVLAAGGKSKRTARRSTRVAKTMQVRRRFAQTLLRQGFGGQVKRMGGGRRCCENRARGIPRTAILATLLPGC